MNDDSADERLALVSRTAATRAAALTSWVTPERLGTDGLAAVLYRCGGCTPSAQVDPRWPHLLLRRAERGVRGALGNVTRTSSPGWMSWTRTGVDATHLVHKIYVSPAMSSLAEALTITFAVAADLGVPAWKVGGDVAGIHRADKVVLYLDDESEADRTAEALARSLAHCAPQGVPFTGQVGRTGVVSRGRDQFGTSWRAIVCRALAQSLWDARARRGPNASPHLVAEDGYAHLASVGIDVVGWRPTSVLVGASDEHL